MNRNKKIVALIATLSVILLMPNGVQAWTQGYTTTMTEEYTSSYSGDVFSEVSCSAEDKTMEVKGVSSWPESAHSMYMFVGISFTPNDNCKIKMGSTWSLSYKITTGGAAGEVYIYVYYYLYSSSWSELANVVAWQDGLHTWWPLTGSSSGGASRNHYDYYTLNYNVLEGNTYYLVVYFKVWMQGTAQLTSQTGASHCVLEIQSIAYVQT